MDVLRAVVLIGIIGLLVGFLAIFVRHAIVGSLVSRGAKARLRVPDPTGVERACSVRPSPELVEFFRNAPQVEMTFVTLIDTSSSPPQRWPVEQFIPLTGRDAGGFRASIGADRAIPIGLDSEKGAYVVVADGSVWHLSAREREAGGRRLVARDINAFRAFEVSDEY